MVFPTTAWATEIPHWKRWAAWLCLLICAGTASAETLNAVAASNPSAGPFHYDGFGRASYLAMLTPYFLLLALMVWRYRVILRFANWWFYVRAATLVLVVLGFGLEWLAGILRAWTFPPGHDFFDLKIPIFGWITGHEVPVCELVWIVSIVPLFYYLWFWATLVFHDVIYVVDENGNFYKKEERWVGFHAKTRILTRRKGQRGLENERALLERPPGFIARRLRRQQHVENA